MNDNSWMLLREQDPAWRMPAGLAERDAIGARDCGWVEQMLPFIDQFCPEGGTVLDPFCGFGSTLVAAQLHGRRGIGIEVEPARAALTTQRLQALGTRDQTVVLGDAASVCATLPQVDLVLTNLPYFGCRWQASDNADAQLYGTDTYARFLDKLYHVFLALDAVVADGGYVIVMAENLRIGTTFVPMAWDAGRLLAERFDLVDERILMYERAHRPLAPMEHGNNRAHEHALIARKQPCAIDLDDSWRCVVALARAFPELVVYGSFARWLLRTAPMQATSGRMPSDVDLLVPPEPALLACMARWLERAGFQLVRWGMPLGSAAAPAAMPDAHYLRATRLQPGGALCRIDLCFDDPVYTVARARERAVRIDGVWVFREE